MNLRILFILCLGFTLQAQENLKFQLPPKEILELADFERAPSVNMDSKKQLMILSYRNTYKTLEDLNQEEMRLGGLRINPITNISSTATFINNIKLKRITDKTESQVSGLPNNPRIANYSLSPDEKKLAFTHTTPTGNELWIVDLNTFQAKKLTGSILNANMGNPISWFKDSQSLLIRAIPKNKPQLIDEKKNIPDGPIVSISEGVVSQNRTYQDLLKNKTDEANFDALATSELLKVDLNGNTSAFLPSALYSWVSFSPDGNYLMANTIEKPYSYIVPYNRFPQKTAVYNQQGQLVQVVNEMPLNEIQPKGFSSTRTGKRNMSWRADASATLFFVEALDGGDQAMEVTHRDELFLWEAPFKNAPTSFFKTQQRFAGVQWGTQDFALVMDMWYDTRNTKTYVVNPSLKEN
ncbi:MAG: S9 family peptidase, partial [Flavobacterium sp.]